MKHLNLNILYLLKLRIPRYLSKDTYITVKDHPSKVDFLLT